VHCFNHRFWDPFIAKREIPSTNGEEEIFDLSMPQVARGWCMN
jgi:hypothetical protein